MELKNYLVELLSNIIHDRLQDLSKIKNDIKKIDDYKKIEEAFSDVNNIVKVDNKKLRKILSTITDDETINGILSNVDMIKIVVNGMNDGLDLSLDDNQKELVKSVYEMVNNYRTELETKDNEKKEYLETFISKCEQLSGEIGTGVVRTIDVLDEIFKENEVPLQDVIKSKFNILRNNNNNYNLNLDSHTKEEVDLRIVLKKMNIEFDKYNELEKKILINNTDLSSIDALADFISDNKIELEQRDLFTLMLFSDVESISNILEITTKYNLEFKKLSKIPGVFIKESNNEKILNIIEENKEDNEFNTIERLKYVGTYNELFIKNIKLLEENNIDIKECFESNILSLIVPDIKKNITILSDLKLSNKNFSIIVINPFLATSISSFNEFGLKDYIKDNPLRLTTSYYRLKQINSNIIAARKSGKIIFRSLSDKKNYWLAKEITR